MAILTQFIFRVTFGLALAMAITPARWVTSGYYRNHLYVLLGLNVVSTLVALAHPNEFPLWPAVAAAALSYIGSVLWLYEKSRVGFVVLVLLSAIGLVGAWMAAPESTATGPPLNARILRVVNAPTSGLVLGSVLAAMFLGHWYLNTPTMELAPLRRLLILIFASLAARATVCGIGLALFVAATSFQGTDQVLLVLLRWLAGIVGAFAIVAMTWQTLKIPNTQAATGLLYVAVILTFLGELVSLLLGTQVPFPL